MHAKSNPGASAALLKKKSKPPSKKKKRSFRQRIALCLVLGFAYIVHRKSANGMANLLSKNSSQTSSYQAAGLTSMLRKLPNCTKREQDIIKQQLPFSRSMNYATKCPDATWLQEHSIATEANKKNKAIGIYLGCNKGMDAISALRRLSYNQQFDTTRWKQALDPSGNMLASGVCGQGSAATMAMSAGLFYTNETQARLRELARQQEATLEVSSANTSQAHVYCVEAMPNMAQLMKSTAQTLNWDTSFHVTHAAISDTDGEAYFPKSSSEMGVESMGLSDCTTGSLNITASCQAVPQWTLDTFVDNNDIHGDIDILSIDVEGYDYEVLVGSKRTLKLVKYLEFEVNGVGRWPENSLEMAIDMLSENGFACYWAGTAGHLWRITGCFVPLFEAKFWSNVACVKQDNSFLATRMELVFQETLAANLTYQDGWKDRTDGIFKCDRPCRQEFRRQRALLKYAL